jgi:hypothetical protein
MGAVRARNSHKFSSYSRKTRFSLFPFLDFQKWKWARDLKMAKKGRWVELFPKKVPVRIFLSMGRNLNRHILNRHFGHATSRWVDIRGDKFENRKFKFQISNSKI